MPTFLNPASYLDDLVDFFEVGADSGGVEIDEELCRGFAETIADLAEKFDALVAFARASGCVEALEERAAPLTPTARRALARNAVDEAAGAAVVRFPTVSLYRTVACSEGTVA